MMGVGWLAMWLVLSAEGPAIPREFTPLESLPAPKIIGAAVAHPGAYGVERIVDGLVATEYSSNGKGTETFIVFDFGKAVRIGGFRHIDRRDPATVAESRLVFANSPDMASPVGSAAVRHANTPGGVTHFALPQPVTARYVRWQVVALGPKKYGTVGGAEIRFYAAGEPQATPARAGLKILGRPVVLREAGRQVRPVRVVIDWPYAESLHATLRLSQTDSQPLQLGFGGQTVEFMLPAEERPLALVASLEVSGKVLARGEATLPPVRHWTVHLHSHSHVDIGYTNVQTEIEKLHWKYTEQALEIIERTASYPDGAQFKWNSEVLWAIDSYLRQATPEKRERLAQAVRAGRFHLDAMYGNELTGLCRPEELIRLFACARRLGRELGVTVDSAMISDVPGYTWGVVPAMAQQGIRYFWCGTNHIHRIGRTIEVWGDRPFFWVSPSGQERVLCWVAGKGYSWFHIHGRFERVAPDTLFEYLEQLEAAGFPYDLLPLRYSIDGDNGPPDPKLPDGVKAWNEKYEWPKLRIATTAETFREFEKRHGAKLPEVRGDFTPYWEDGAASSADETRRARIAAERLVQAEALWASRRLGGYPVGDFEKAWRNVLLYNEHTWGAHCSISQPDSDFTKAQWAIKQRFALDGIRQAGELLMRSLPPPAERPSAIDVFNSLSWTRSGLVEVRSPHAQAIALTDEQGHPVPCQIGTDGTLYFVARDVPPLGSKRYLIKPQAAASSGRAAVGNHWVANGRLRAVIDEATGAIASLTWEGIAGDLVDHQSGLGLNEYQYVSGRKPDKPQRSGPAKTRLFLPGPVVATLEVESPAPGCEKILRHLTVVDGLDGLGIIVAITRTSVRTPDAVHLAFPFNVPGGIMRLDIPWAVIRPEVDQLPGACRNYLSVGRWVDVSNERYGVTCATLDTPLMEVGAIRMDVPNPFDPRAWVAKLEPSTTFYSYVMNNYWETNYKADQPGVAVFRYVLRPHGPFDQAAAIRFGIEASQPLWGVPSNANAPKVDSLFSIEPAEVLATSVKPSDDGKAVMVRLWNAGTGPVQARMTWQGVQPRRVTRSSPAEETGPVVDAPIPLPPLGLVTLRAEL